ncbi:MAG: Ferredoxin, 2Fe-2S [Legionellaceae bacterium]
MYYKKHIFFCVNQRSDGEPCCNNFGAENAFTYIKTKVKSLGLAGKKKIRVNKAGCLGRCDEGPVIVIYPDEIWYRYKNEADLDKIVNCLENDTVAEDLLIVSE